MRTKLKKTHRGPKKITPFLAVIMAFLVLWMIVFFLLAGWLVLNVFKTPAQYKNFDLGGSLAFPSPVSFANMPQAFVQLQEFGYGVPVMVFNSLWRVAGSIVIGQLCANMVAYSLAKYKFFGRDAIYWAIIITMMLPVYGTMPAQLRLYRALGMYDTPLILLNAIGIGGTLIPYSCYKNLSWTYAEATFLDGGGHYTVFFRVMLPQLAGIIAVFFVNAFIGAWNDWMTNYLYLPSKPQVAYAIYLVQGEATRISDYQMFYSAVMIGLIVPLIVFAIFSKKILSTVYTGGLKG